MRRLLTLDECAQRTSTTVRWWRRAVSEGRVPVVHLGRLVRIDEADLEALIEAGRSERRVPAVTRTRRVAL
jgi:excisionase family DNA binding protein